MLNAMRRSKERRLRAERIYAVLVARSRDPVFFERYGVRDSLDGRFDLLTLHAWLVLGRLKGDALLSQALVDTIFTGFDEAFRELGSGDLGLGRRLKQIADAFYGRLAAYDAAGDEAGMAAALVRNLYRGVSPEGAAAMAHYVWRTRARLESWQDGDPDFGPLPEEE